MARNNRKNAAAVWNVKADEFAQAARNWDKVAKWNVADKQVQKDVRAEARRRAAAARADEARCRFAARSWAA